MPRARRLTSHPSKAGLLFGLGVLAAAACHKDPVVTTRTVTVYAPAACAPGPGALAAYAAYGDFEPPAQQLTVHLLGDVGTPLPEIDPAVRALVVNASESPDAAGAAQLSWEGWSPVASTGDVDVLLTPTLGPCALTTTVGARPGAAMAPIGGDAVLVAGGTGDPVPPTYLANLGTGAVTSLGPNDLNTPRTNATVTAFGPGALVAGGSNAGSVLSNAEVYSAALGGFDLSLAVTLSRPRTQHGAVVMASGQTLLVGGLGGQGPSDVLDTMEIVDPTLDRSIAEGIATLAYARANPTVMRLASGEILVAGGVDGNGSPVPWLEWFKADVSDISKPAFSLAQGAGSAFIALEQGGAMAVLTTPPGATQPFANVYVFDSTGAFETATSFPGDVTAPVLFGGAGGAPVLWTGSTWLQWQPYAGAFQALGVADQPPTNVGAPATSPDPGLAMWLDPTTDALTLMRFDTRNAYSSLGNPLLTNGTTDTAPDPFTDVSFDPETGMTLQPGSPGAAVFVTDRTYADVQVTVSTTTGVLPLVELVDDAGNELDVGAAPCTVLTDTSTATTMVVTRMDTSVTYTLGPTVTGSCPTPWASGARLSVGVRGQTTGTATAKDFVVTRLGEP